MAGLWKEGDVAVWRAALGRYPATAAAYGSARLAELDRWLREELPQAVAARPAPLVTLQELVWATEWKMLRGVWRARNLQLVRANPDAEVQRLSREALAAAPDPRAPVTLLCKLAGAGPATASAILATLRPEIYPFFDEVVAAQLPGFPPVDFGAKQYQQYAAALRERSAALNAADPSGGWTPHAVDLALWAAVEGKKRGAG